MAKVLIVDDSEMTRTVLQHQMLKLGHDVLAAASGAEAVVEIGQQSFDLVLLDVRMEDMDGHAVLSALRASGKLEGLPVVVVSGVEDQHEIARCLEAGAKAFIQKPPKRDDLVKAIEHWVTAEEPAGSDANGAATADGVNSDGETDPKDLDVEVLRNLPRGIGKETPLERAVRYERMVPRHLGEFEAAAREKDRMAMSRAAGLLRSEAERVGAQKLAIMTRSAEEACDGNRIDEAVGYSETLPGLVEASLAEMRDLKRTL